MLCLALFAALLGQDDFVVRADVQNVLLPVTVTDRKGRFVEGLDQTDFEIYENGRRQQIAAFASQDVPVTAGLIIDNSSSMRPRRDSTRHAAMHFVRSSNPEDEAFVITFNDRVAFGLPEGVDFTGDGKQLHAALSGELPSGRTALYDALAAALDHLERGKHDRKALLVVSDGGDTASRIGFDAVLHRARSSQVAIYTVCLTSQFEHDPEQRPDLLEKLSRETGGLFFRPRTPQELFEACGRVAHELRNQYVLTYSPQRAAGTGGWRKIDVVVKAPERGKMRVRTRKGYYAAGVPAETPAGSTP